MTIDALHPRARVLDVLPELGEDLDPAAFAEARRLLTVPVTAAQPGPWDPSAQADSDVRGDALGWIVLEGVVVREAILADRVATSLYGPEDLIGLDDLAGVSLPVRSRFQVAVPARLGVLDDRFLAVAQRFPRLFGRMLVEAMAQIGRGFAHQAISQLPRVEDRLVALFWHLADRWGHVGPDGVAVDLPLTHDALGRLIGARRPTVSLGLQLLAERGHLSRRPEGTWLLSAESIEVLAADEPSLQRLRSVLTRPAPAQAPAAARLPAVDRERLLERLADARAALERQRERTTEAMARNAALRAQVQAARTGRTDGDR